MQSFYKNIDTLENWSIAFSRSTNHPKNWCICGPMCLSLVSSSYKLYKSGYYRLQHHYIKLYLTWVYPIHWFLQFCTHGLLRPPPLNQGLLQLVPTWIYYSPTFEELIWLASSTLKNMAFPLAFDIPTTCNQELKDWTTCSSMTHCHSAHYLIVNYFLEVRPISSTQRRYCASQISTLRP